MGPVQLIRRAELCTARGGNLCSHPVLQKQSIICTVHDESPCSHPVLQKQSIICTVHGESQKQTNTSNGCFI